TFYLGALFAPAIAPYPMDFQSRELSWAPPTRVHLMDADGRFQRPFVYGITSESVAEKRYAEDRSVRYPIRLFVQGEPYRLFGMKLERRILGVDRGGRLFLFGADLYGRDVFSRVVHGSRISLSVGLVGIAISFTLGLLLGGIAGYFGGAADTILMRLTEILMSVPGLYMILALRSVFPDDMPSDRMYLIIVGILALISWASLSRVIRGMVLSIRQNEYVTAARALGMGGLRIILRHILPNTMSFTIVAATITVPAYILGEVALSFLGVGIQEPQASWGLMLSQAQNVSVLSSFPWVLTSGYFIFITVLAYNFLGDGLRDALDPRKVR
ncbi:MAG TPA: ABC transporter permease, partial [Candidatus Udaeobacter sp.]|nr:ABC transporter permease [Candidatus Udaeobacter sp.]